VADESNNQVLVRAPQKQQVEFERLIKRLDLRRPQVFLDVKIVAVTWTDDKQLGVELQGINASGAGGLGSTSFGLSTFPNGATGAKEITTALLGLTAAVVNTDQVPIIINAVANTVDGRIISSPKLLVDDNESSTIKSVQSVPYQSVSQGQNSDVVSFGGSEEAGTTLEVTPSISEGGEVRLEYSITLSDFVGTGSSGLPPPKVTREISSAATTVQSDMTVIIGGIEIKDTAKTRIRVPLIGDIPLIGLLFGSRRNEETKSNLYVFITPRVLRDPTPVDYRLMTRGPQASAGLATDLPPIAPISIPIVGQVSDATREEGEE
jgi:general secretion pathway protein D